MISENRTAREAVEALNASDLQGLARVEVRCRAPRGIDAGTVRPLAYHPHSFDPGDGRGKADWHRRLRAQYAERAGR